MQSKPKTNSIITSHIPDDTDYLEFMVRVPARMVFEVRNPDGTMFREVEFDLSAVHPDNLGRAVVHGFNQRIPDAAAIGLTDADGNIIPKTERTRIKAERMNDLCRFYESGTEAWGRKGDGGGGRSLTIEAIARVKAIEYDRAVEMVDRHAATVCGGDRKKALRELAKSPKVQAAMNAIRAERTPVADETADDLLDSME